MQARGIARFSPYRLTGLAVAVALIVGILVGGQVDLVSAWPSTSGTRHESVAPAAQAEVPLFIVGDADGLYHHQQAPATIASRCITRSLPVFIGGDIDGLANPAVNAVIPTPRCNKLQN